MSDRPADLPDFDNPPVVEVVLGIQFASVSGFRTVHAGLLWQEFKEQFHRFQERPPLDPVFETFGPRATPTATVRFELAGPPLPRLWFLNEAETELIQFQRDRFLHNWRKVGSDAAYPRYESIKVKFAKELNTLQTFLARNNLGSIAVNQCEVTYVNHILSEPGEDLRAQLGTVFTIWKDQPDCIALAGIEDVRFVVRYTISSDGEPQGRLTASAEPGRSRAGAPMIALTLTGRGQPAEPTVSSALDFLDLCRDKIVRAFAALTTDKMHQRWGRTQ